MHNTDFLTLLMTPDKSTASPGAVALGARTAHEAPHYWRCNECLTTFTTRAKLQRHRDCGDPSIHCAICACGNDRIEYMGQSKVDRLALTKELCACDFRCTEATGPNCTCQCGGVNHGTGKLVTVTIDNGPIPRIEMKSPELCRLSREAWTQAKMRAEARLQIKHGENLRKKRANQWIDHASYCAILADQKAILAAQKLRTQKGRIAAMDKAAR